MEMADLIDACAARLGIQDHWYDYRGERHEVSRESKVALLRAMGVPADEPGTLAQYLEEARLADWYGVLPPVVVLREQRDGGIPITVRGEHAGFEVDWRIHTETGSILAGSFRPDELMWLDEAVVEGVLHQRYGFRPACALPQGYHRFELISRGESAPFASCHLIAVPEHCYQPEAIAEGGRLWGISVQLYTLRSEKNWGIGDFGDLAELAAQSAELGADFIALNPLHALFPSNPAHASPYSPSSREFLNTLYIDVPAVPEFTQCAEARALVEDTVFQERLKELRAKSRVDYVGVADLKRKVLGMLYEHFCSHDLAAGSQRAIAYRSFCEQGGEDLRRQAHFDALSDLQWRAQGATGWDAWPEEYRRPDGPAIARFAEADQERIGFYKYLQWIAAEQLEQASTAATHAGMRVGLYLDIAVGVDPTGAEAWQNVDVLSASASVGAPPDPLALTGQDWGVPPYVPTALARKGHRPFAALLAANMRNAGALRIDHVMALYRLWWIPQGMECADGAYVHYPVDDLFGIVALESQRNRCLVIGEDLGTVPDAIREAMPDYGLFSYRVLYFEKEADGACVRPGDYPRQALVTVSTHDLPPFRSYWEGSDLALRDQLGLFPNEQIREDSYEGREADRRALIAALVEAGEWPPPAKRVPGYTAALAEAVERFAAQSRSGLLAVQFEDWLGMEDPVNVPGTSTEHANWQRKLTLPFVDILSDPRIWDHATKLNARRDNQAEE